MAIPEFIQPDAARIFSVNPRKDGVEVRITCYVSQEDADRLWALRGPEGEVRIVVSGVER